MNILNLALRSINANRGPAPKDKINITNNVSINKVEDAKIGIDKTNTTLSVDFTYITKYSPDFATIEIKGNLVVLEESAKAKKVLESYKKDKKLPKDFSTVVINALMSRCTIEVIMLTKELGLPSPIPLPRVQAQEPTKK